MFAMLRKLFRRLPIHHHEWEDGYTFASCFEVTIPRGGAHPVCFRVMQFCATCAASQRRLLTKAEYDAWDEELREAWNDGDEHVGIEYLREIAA